MDNDFRDFLIFMSICCLMIGSFILIGMREHPATDFCRSKNDFFKDVYIPDGLKNKNYNITKIECGSRFSDSKIYDVEFVIEEKEIVNKNKWTGEIESVKHKLINKFIEVKGGN